MIPVFPVSCFGNIDYVRSIAQFPAIELEACEHFPKRTFRNRYEILSPQGRMLLTIPVEKPNGSKTHTKDVLIADQKNWRTDHLRALQACYRSSPYFEHYESEIEHLLLDRTNGRLVDFAIESTNWLLQQFGISLEMSFSEQFHTETHDLLTENQTYSQVFFGQPEFTENLSAIDLLCNIGPAGKMLIVKNL